MLKLYTHLMNICMYVQYMLINMYLHLFPLTPLIFCIYIYFIYACTQILTNSLGSAEIISKSNHDFYGKFINIFYEIITTFVQIILILFSKHIFFFYFSLLIILVFVDLKI